jgi:predicted phage terminase large subunit-like protein
MRRRPDLAGIAFRGVRPDKDKYSRALPWATRAEGGRVRLVRGDWINAFLDEALSFPYGAHDDQIDSVSGGVAMLSGGGAGAMLDYLKKMKERSVG